MQSLIERGQGVPRAFMCSSLLILEGALQQIKSHAGRIDPRVLIGTFDDHTMLDLLPNPVFSIRQNEKLLAQRVFERLISLHDGQDVMPSIIAADLLCRNLPRESGAS